MIRAVILLIIVSFPFHTHSEEINPWHAYKVISQVIDDLHSIRGQKKINTIIEAIPFDNSKTPTDVYEKTHQLLEKVIKLSTKKGHQIHYNQLLPKKKTGRMIPADVLELLNEIDTITSQIRNNLQNNNTTIEFDIEYTKTPPYVYQKVIKAIALVDTLL